MRSVDTYEKYSKNRSNRNASNKRRTVSNRKVSIAIIKISTQNVSLMAHISDGCSLLLYSFCHDLIKNNQNIPPRAHNCSYSLISK